jgi:two-component system osmolarity sensor histidine kinase EnvZ
LKPAQPKRLRLGNPLTVLNSLFGRMVLLMVFLLIAEHLSWVLSVGRPRPQEQFDAVRRETLLAVSVLGQQHGLGEVVASGAFAPTLKSALRQVRQVPLDAPEAPQEFAPGSGSSPGSGSGPGPDFGQRLGAHLDPRADASPPPSHRHMPPEVRALRQALQDDLPPGSEVRMRPPPQPQIWVHVAGRPDWIVVPVGGGPPFGGPLIDLSIALSLAIVCAVLGAWQLQRPLRDLARAASRVHPDHQGEPVRERGPSEVRRVIRHFNQSARELAQLESDRAVMLAGVAHDLRAPLTRIRARAEIVSDASLALGFMRDAASLSQIVDQFLDFARRDGDASPLTEVDAFCRQHWDTLDGLPGAADVRLTLSAGAAFRLPLTDLDRIVSNLIDNALTHGAAPVELITAAAPGGGWVLSVRDHGAGIASAQLSQVTRPFVRLDPSRGGSHCGLGLAIVQNLALRHHAALGLENGPHGGLHVTLTFPA